MNLAGFYATKWKQDLEKRSSLLIHCALCEQMLFKRYFAQPAYSGDNPNRSRSLIMTGHAQTEWAGHLEKKLKLTDPPPHSLQGLNIVAFIFNIEDINILSKNKYIFIKFHLKAFQVTRLPKTGYFQDLKMESPIILIF